jgi:hypothetical protein
VWQKYPPLENTRLHRTIYFDKRRGADRHTYYRQRQYSLTTFPYRSQSQGISLTFVVRSHSGTGSYPQTIHNIFGMNALFTCDFLDPV